MISYFINSHICFNVIISTKTAYTVMNKFIVYLTQISLFLVLLTEMKAFKKDKTKNVLQTFLKIGLYNLLYKKEACLR